MPTVAFALRRWPAMPTQAAGCFAVSLAAIGLANVQTVPAYAAPKTSAAKVRRPRQAGDVLRVFDGQSVYVVTNSDPALADVLLEGCRQKDRRVLTLDEWKATPPGVQLYATIVFLIDRERLPANESVPTHCNAERDELHTELIRHGTTAGLRHEIILSAPDAAWLRQSIADFRSLIEVPRGPQKRNVRSLAVIASSPGAALAAAGFLKASPVRAHLVSAAEVIPTDARRIDMDDVILIDRSASLPSGDAGVLFVNSQAVKPNDTVIWRERKGANRARVVVSAPNPDLLTDALRHTKLDLVSDVPTVVHTARDLRSVRRIAVATLESGNGDKELARRMASRAATELRSLDAFEVLERAGLSQILGEVALGQAGITKSGDRARVRQLAAADALLIVEVGDVSGRTDYKARYERITPRLGNPPPRPVEPSRLKYAVTLPGKENDRLVRGLTDALLSRAVGTRSDREYKELLNQYNEETLPRWERERERWEQERRNRPVQWRQINSAQCGATVSGSVRLVDLTDGLVLWEAPFTGTAQNDEPGDDRVITTRGDDSQPGDGDAPPASETAPPPTLLRAADDAVAQAVLALKGTARLPSTAPADTTASDAHASSPTGRLLDVDGLVLLIGLGQSDGVKLGDTLRVATSDGQTVEVTVTRVRPRTCDASFAADTSLSARTRVQVGASVVPAANALMGGGAK